VWQLNYGVYRPDLAIVLTGDPQIINARLRARGGHSRFERAADNSTRETELYIHAVADLEAKGWPVTTLDATAGPPEAIADRIVSLVHTVLTEKSPACL
jgi:dTMP kinase